MPRVSKAEHAARVGRVVSLLTSFGRPRSIVVVLQEQYGISRRQAQRYIRAAWDRLREEAQRNLKNDAAQYRAAVRSLLYDAIADGDRRTATDLLRLEAERLGVGRSMLTFNQFFSNADDTLPPDVAKDVAAKVAASRRQGVGGGNGRRGS